MAEKGKKSTGGAGAAAEQAAKTAAAAGQFARDAAEAPLKAWLKTAGYDKFADSPAGKRFFESASKNPIMFTSLMSMLSGAIQNVKPKMPLLQSAVDILSDAPSEMLKKMMDYATGKSKTPPVPDMKEEEADAFVTFLGFLWETVGTDKDGSPRALDVHRVDQTLTWVFGQDAVLFDYILAGMNLLGPKGMKAIMVMPENQREKLMKHLVERALKQKEKEQAAKDEAAMKKKAEEMKDDKELQESKAAWKAVEKELEDGSTKWKQQLAAKEAAIAAFHHTPMVGGKTVGEVVKNMSVKKLVGCAVVGLFGLILIVVFITAAITFSTSTPVHRAKSSTTTK